MVGSHEIQLMITNLMEDRIPLEDALVIAQKDRGDAEHNANMMLIDLEMARKGETDGQGWRLTRFLWKLLGPYECITRQKLSMRWTVTQTFLAKCLTEHPEEFDQEMLAHVLNHAGGNQPLTNKAKEAQASLLKGEAKHLRAQGIELNRDMNAVRARVSQFGFDPDLNALLGKVEAGLHEPADRFDDAAIIGHLRTFFEHVHREAAEKLHAAKPETKDGTDLRQCQNVIDYLQRKDVIEDSVRRLGRGLYGVLSEKGSHAIASTREYVRLCRNMVAEYALVLFFELERRLKE